LRLELALLDFSRLLWLGGCSGAEDVALIEYAHLTGRPFRVFSLETGRLNPETYRLFAEVEKRYNIHIQYMFPDAAEVEELVRAKGLFSFYEDGHQECCRVRKVRPLRRALKGLKAWITGQRKDQSPGTRANVPVVQVLIATSKQAQLTLIMEPKFLKTLPSLIFVSGTLNSSQYSDSFLRIMLPYSCLADEKSV